MGHSQHSVLYRMENTLRHSDPLEGFFELLNRLFVSD